MATKKELIDNELLKEVISIRVDTLWKMLGLRKEGRLPDPKEEGATGKFDNKGAIIVPGGYVFQDSDKESIVKEKNGILSPQEFRKSIRDAMKLDNATLIYEDWIATGVNLDNGFFVEIASDILANKIAATRRKKAFGEKPPEKIKSHDISRSYCPTYVSDEKYGSRTKLSSCISVCLTEPWVYYTQCKTRAGLRGDQAAELYENIRKSQKPVIGKNGVVLAPPYVVVCHTTRYREGILGGITRILGIGKFGEFASFTLEEATTELLNDINPEKKEYAPGEIFAEYDNKKVVGVLRIYPETHPGNRGLKGGITTILVSPEKDLNLDLETISKEARKRYNIPEESNPKPIESRLSALGG